MNQVPESVSSTRTLKSHSRWLFIGLFLMLPLMLDSCVGKQSVAVEHNELPKLVVSPVQRGTISSMLQLTGTVLALPDHSINVSPAIAGKVTAVFVVPGQIVHKGQLLARLDSTQLSQQVKQAHAQVDAAEAAEDQAEIALKVAGETERRMQRLVASDIGAKKDLEAAQGQLETAKEQLNAAHSKFEEIKAAAAATEAQLAYTAIRSPIAGIVANRFVNETDSVTASTALVQIVDLSQVYINALLPPSLPDPLRPGLPAVVSTPADPNVRLGGRIAMIAPVVDTQSGYIPVQILCTNPGYLLKQGQPVTVFIAERTDLDAMLVPSTAVVASPDDAKKHMVYVYNSSDSTIKRVDITEGIKQNDLVEVTYGLSDGQLIVVANAYGIPDGTKIEAQIAKVYPHTQTAIARD